MKTIKGLVGEMYQLAEGANLLGKLMLESEELVRENPDAVTCLVDGLAWQIRMLAEEGDRTVRGYRNGELSIEDLLPAEAARATT